MIQTLFVPTALQIFFSELKDWDCWVADSDTKTSYIFKEMNIQSNFEL